MVIIVLPSCTRCPYNLYTAYLRIHRRFDRGKIGDAPSWIEVCPSPLPHHSAWLIHCAVWAGAQTRGHSRTHVRGRVERVKCLVEGRGGNGRTFWFNAGWLDAGLIKWLEIKTDRCARCGAAQLENAPWISGRAKEEVLYTRDRIVDVTEFSRNRMGGF